MRFSEYEIGIGLFCFCVSTPRSVVEKTRDWVGCVEDYAAVESRKMLLSRSVRNKSVGLISSLQTMSSLSLSLKKEKKKVIIISQRKCSLQYSATCIYISVAIVIKLLITLLSKLHPAFPSCCRLNFCRLYI